MNFGKNPDYVATTEVSLTVWRAPDGQVYAYPLTKSFGGIGDPFSAMPDLTNPQWTNLGTLPQGMAVDDVTKKGRLFDCTIGGVRLLTCDTVVGRYS